MISKNTVILGETELALTDIVRVGNGLASVSVSDDPAWLARINSSANCLSDEWQDQKKVYGVTTGYGHACTVSVPTELVEELPKKLTEFHGCGLGKHLEENHARAVMLVRLASFTRGLSGVRVELFETISRMINSGMVPVMPEEGTVGASGDLTPLSYLAANIMGEREVFFRGERMPAAQAMQAAEIEPLALMPKEGLALMNGTSVMTALACYAYDRAEYLCRLSSRITSLVVESLSGNRTHFKEALFKAKPFPGQAQVAGWIRADLDSSSPLTTNGHKVQDRYSLRCAPHVIGVLADALPWMKRNIEIEVNSANDNPLIDGDTGAVLHGGHFYGGHIAFAMDSLKNCVANIADLLDRQLALLVDCGTNNGLPANLSGAKPERAPINHGYKAVQIGTSAWAAEALKLTMPASVFSRSTESHNQDKVSMGTIASRDCLRVLELTEQVASAVLLGAVQGLELRLRNNEVQLSQLSPQLRGMYEQVMDWYTFVEEDRPLESDLRKGLELISSKDWGLY